MARIDKRYLPIFQEYKYCIVSKSGKILCILQSAENREDAEKAFKEIKS